MASASSLTKESKILIVGGGTWGCSTALHLARRGYTKVTLLDVNHIPSPISAGHDVNKIASGLNVPDNKGDDEDAIWQSLTYAQAQGWLHDPVFKPYYHDTGYVISASTPKAIKQVVEEDVGDKIDEFTPLNTAEDFRKTMPEGILTGDFPGWKGFYKSTGSGWVHARKAMTAAFEESKRLGVKFITGSPEGEAQSLIIEDGDVKGAKTADGKEHRADRTILSAGASAERFLDFENQIRATAWTLGHIQMTPEETQLYKNLPVLFNINKGFFMEPDEDLHQLKMCDEHPGYVNWIEKPGAKFPQSIPFAKRQIPLESELRMRDFLRDIMPQLADRPLVHARICWCADTYDRNFLITYHPRHPSLVIASGDCGTGYKHITSIGKFISDCMEGRLEERFAKFWTWRPEKFTEFWGNDPLDRFGADDTIMDLPTAETEGWTDIKEDELIS
ncbi:proline dehydrogenase [Fusarium sporotrichioides]|uniref:Proline dehydrogenase n=1 Tax=Fusarium sporotrichioides TaxID=5514 RepID=A0A395SNY6_FUSSP|nr:proline dehydrogenase [Fusarium sporotrichioides]